MMTIATIIQPLFIGTTELLLIGGMALLLFGGKKLPEMMRGLGQGVKEFKKGVNEGDVSNEEGDASKEEGEAEKDFSKTDENAATGKEEVGMKTGMNAESKAHGK